MRLSYNRWNDSCFRIARQLWTVRKHNWWSLVRCCMLWVPQCWASWWKASHGKQYQRTQVSGLIHTVLAATVYLCVLLIHTHTHTHTHTALLEEGQAIERVGFIKEGRCLAYAKVPNTPRPVQVSTQQCHIQWCGKGGNKIIFLISVGVRWWAWPGQLYWRATLEGKRNSAIFYCLCSPSEGWMGWWYSHKRQVLEDTEM